MKAESHPSLNPARELLGRFVDAVALSREFDRSELLQRITDALLRDESVGAAWLGGSFGRGRQDAWSDLDLSVAVDDELASPHPLGDRPILKSVGKPVLSLSMSANAPASGDYLLTLYAAPSGSQQVDWYWHPASMARIPNQAAVLFNRIGLNREEKADPAGSIPALAQELLRALGNFWVMVAIAAKSIVRRSPWNTFAMLDHVVRLEGSITWMLRERSIPSYDDLKPYYRSNRWAFPTASPQSQLETLRAIAISVSDRRQEIAAIGVDPLVDAIDEIDRLLDEVASAISE